MSLFNKEEYHRMVDKNIQKFGFHMTFVFKSETPSFCYSTGLSSSFGIPDIFISSLPENLSYELISNYVEIYKKSKIIPLNIRVDNVSDRFPVYFIEIDNSKLSNYVLSSVRYYKDGNYKYYQLIFPDTNGNFPNDIGYEYDQEIFGDFNT